MSMIHIKTIWHPKLEEKTLEVHRDKLVTKKKVYWGVIHDDEYPKGYRNLLDEHLSALRDQMKGGTATYVFIATLDPDKDYLVGVVAGDVLKGNELEGGANNDLVPPYYRRELTKKKELSVSYWIPLSDLQEVTHGIYKQARLPEEYRKYDRRFRKYGGRPYPTICDFTAEAELRKFLKSAPEIDKVFSPSVDFRTVTLHKREYTLTDRQAETVRILYDAYKEGTRELSKKYILKELKPETSKFRDIFQKSEAAHNLVAGGSNNRMCRLNV